MRTSNSFEIGDRFKELRLKKGLNQTQFAELIGMQQSAISSIEKGERLPTTEQLLYVSGVFNVSADWLLYGDHDVKFDRVNEPPTNYSPEVKNLLDVLEAVPTIRKSIAAMALLPERDQDIQLGEILKNLKSLEEK